MQVKSSKKPYSIEVEFPNGSTKSVRVKATSQDKAEQRALKFHPNAVKARLSASN